MNYEFSLDKTAVFSLLIGSVAISVLLFGAGLVVGSQWLGSSAAAAGASAKTHEPDLPKEPVLNEQKAPAPKAATPGATAPETTKEPASELVSAPEDRAQTTIATPVNGEVKIIQEAEADPANGDNAATEPEYVTVQIGVFLDEKEADRLLKEFERKGYAPSFFSGHDAEARQWYAVRIGAYSDKHQAANAAANFTRQERMKAVVRPLGSL